MPTYKTNSNSNQKVIYADESLEKFENLSHHFGGITQINDSLWLELG